MGSFHRTRTEPDRIWFKQQKEHLAQSDEPQVVALGNDLQQFSVWLKPQVDEGVVVRRESNGVICMTRLGSHVLNCPRRRW